MLFIDYRDVYYIIVIRVSCVMLNVLLLPACSLYHTGFTCILVSMQAICEVLIPATLQSVSERYSIHIEYICTAHYCIA